MFCHFPKYEIGLELAIHPSPPRGNLVYYVFLKLYYISHKIKNVIPLKVAALTSCYIRWTPK